MCIISISKFEKQPCLLARDYSLLEQSDSATSIMTLFCRLRGRLLTCGCNAPFGSIFIVCGLNERARGGVDGVREVCRREAAGGSDSEGSDMGVGGEFILSAPVSEGEEYR